jgi:hypothetical protein
MSRLWSMPTHLIKWRWDPPGYLPPFWLVHIDSEVNDDSARKQQWRGRSGLSVFRVLRRRICVASSLQGDGFDSSRSRSSTGGVPREQKHPSIPGWREELSTRKISTTGRIGSAEHPSGVDSISLDTGSE